MIPTRLIRETARWRLNKSSRRVYKAIFGAPLRECGTRISKSDAKGTRIIFHGDPLLRRIETSREKRVGAGRRYTTFVIYH
ncbi:hypothetical protein WN51_08185 [Melipona quadrifasciata]|uniref:Uncharacterized protein n=1 Tax=Melipona quadrifasciata TaxID=166423 RepID=A0A0N0BBT5_9HYME|nr:hypothetical protein WN51_08185 [Melipona quadrifasciata]